jgi:hypothetical protein
MTDEREFDDLARELHATREKPRPEFARELDRRAAGWLAEKQRWRLPSMRMAVPAIGAAAAALVIALAVSGGGDDGGDGGDGGTEPLDVAVVSEGPVPGAAPGGGTVPPGVAAPEALETPLQRDSTTEGGGGAFLLLTQEGDTVTVRYLFSAPAKAKLELAGREAEVQIEQGPGSLEISTAGLPAGTHDLTITAPPAPIYRGRVQVGG